MTSYKLVHGNRPLPSGYKTIDDVLAGKITTGRLVSLIGLVKDHQTPIPTKGNDYKCTYTIYDNSVTTDQVGLVLSIFGQNDGMPQPSAGDVLVIISAKVQSFRGSVSLISNHSMSLHLYSASDIPRPPRSAQNALRFSSGSRKPGQSEHEYVSWLWHHTNKDCVPDAVTFQKQVDQSGHMKDKFCKLENVVDGKFCDVIVNVVKAPFYEIEKTTLWVSDYTKNDNFHNFSWDSKTQFGESDGDPYDYLDTPIHTATKWAGPFGKRSIQVTCFEPHASQVYADVQLGQWICIRNLRIKVGNNGFNLEGIMHGNRDIDLPQIDFGRQQIEILNCKNRETCDPHLKQALQRKVDYEKLMKKELKSFTADEYASEEPRLNSKTRRKEKRAAAIKKVEEQDKLVEEKLGLNDLIKCESPEQPVTFVPSIIRPVLWETTVEGEAVTLTLPFTCAKYRTYARVVDFRPSKLENFTTWRKSTEFDVLSDYSSDCDSGSDDDQHNTLGQYAGQKIWEWRFSLQLEDANPKQRGGKERFWVIVDNSEAQQLVGLDACDLHEDQDTLSALREQLFRLWGNLEEVKSREQQRQIIAQRRVAAIQPPSSSPTNDNAACQQSQEMSDEEKRDQNKINLSNKPFACCIRQYGARAREPDPLRANAGDGFKWMRVFGLFGTKIHG
ncbi:hypothetical protein GGS21DRAFT_494297 [Xylaria nigripes]|nr:hypothetical protein GGS21DRAFT_494297 [Xylaria nigripes]